MKDKFLENLKVIFAVLYVIIYMSCFFFVIRYESDFYPTMYMYSYKPYIVGIVLAFSYLYSIIKNMKVLYNMSCFIQIMLYTITFMWINGSSVYHRIGLGAFLYTISFFIFFINFFIRTKEEVKASKLNKLGSGNKMIENPIDIKKEYILANYIKGLTSVQKKKSNLTAIMKKNGEDKIQIAIYTKNPTKLKIKLSDIKSIEIKKEQLNKTKKFKNPEKDQERATIQTYIIGYFGAFSGSDKLVNDIDSYNELNPLEIYNFSLVFLDENKQEVKLEFSSKENPTEFLSKIDNSILTWI